MLHGGVANESAIVNFFCSCDRLTGGKFYYFFVGIEQSTGHVQVKIYIAFGMCGSFYLYTFFATDVCIYVESIQNNK